MNKADGWYVLRTTFFRYTKRKTEFLADWLGRKEAPNLHSLQGAEPYKTSFKPGRAGRCYRLLGREGDKTEEELLLG